LIKEGNMNGWVGVDLDGTLAHYDEWRGPGHIGAPVPKMLERVKQWMAEGLDVRIMTARVHPCNDGKDIALAAIKKWCMEHLGKELPVTWEKDYQMISLWDDRAVQVIPNTGIALQEYIQEMSEMMQALTERSEVVS
jgi:hypothetical protein